MNKKHRVAEYPLSQSSNNYCADFLSIPQGSRIIGTFGARGCPYLVILEPYDEENPYGEGVLKTNVNYWVTDGDAQVPSWANPRALSYVGCAAENFFSGNTLEFNHWHVFIVEDDDTVCYPPSVRRPWEVPEG